MAEADVCLPAGTEDNGFDFSTNNFFNIRDEMESLGHETTV